MPRLPMPLTGISNTASNTTLLKVRVVPSTLRPNRVTALSALPGATSPLVRKGVSLTVSTAVTSVRISQRPTDSVVQTVGDGPTAQPDAPAPLARPVLGIRGLCVKTLRTVVRRQIRRILCKFRR